MTDADKSAYWIVSPGSFAYNPARINVGSIGYLSTCENVIVSSLYEVFQADGTCDDRFLWHWFKSPLFSKQIEMYQEGGVRLYFFFEKLLKSEIDMPSIAEQKVIGATFDKLDDLITLHQGEGSGLCLMTYLQIMARSTCELWHCLLVNCGENQRGGDFRHQKARQRRVIAETAARPLPKR